MKILYISDVYFPRVNGVSTSIQIFRQNLNALGHIVHLIAPDYSGIDTNEPDILRVPARSIPFDPEDRLMSFTWVIDNIQRICDENYDLIHIQTPFVAHYLGIKLSRQFGIPCVETYHTFFEEYLHHYIPVAPRFMTRSVAKHFSRHQGNSLNGMVVPSNPMLTVLRNYGITTYTEVIPTGINQDSFALGNRSSFRTANDIDEDRPVLLFVGRVAHEKNIKFLLQVVNRVRHVMENVLFIITGEGPALVSLKLTVKDMGLEQNVLFIGYLDRNLELNNCYRAADIFIFASRTETQGLVLLEAMAQGTPVVSTAELGTCDVLKDGAGARIAQENLEDFSGKVVDLLKNEEARKKLGEAARDYAHQWSALAKAQQMLNFYNRVIADQAH
jgi:glycosyltransferase involved in cell wall biosynthesis